MHQLLTITWDQPLGLDLGFLTLRYYSLLFAGGFFAGYFVISKIWKREQNPEKWLDSLVTYMVIATVIGARLGHVFFYEWAYYKEHPAKIFAVWEGGLASHGAAVAIIIALIIYSKKVTLKSPLWILDRIVIVVALAAMFIRIGNMMNSEIYGMPANSSAETVFLNPARESILGAFDDRITEVDFEETGETLATDSLTYPVYKMTLAFVPQYKPEAAKDFTERYIAAQLNNKKIDDRNVVVAIGTQATVVAGAPVPTIAISVLGVPRYPTQLYEAAAYLIIFLILFYLYWHTGFGQRHGFLFGAFLVLLFGFRFFIEYLKANQVDFEATMNLNMGQWLSIPLVLAGLYFMFASKTKNTDAKTA